MSDSDETLCGNESGEETTENSPSILSNWHPDEAVLFTQKSGKNLEKNTCEENRRDVVDGNVMIESQETVSQEFPLLTCGLKRKEHFDETDEATVNAKNVNSKESLNQSRQSSTERENISNDSTTESRTTVDDDKRLEKLLKTMEESVKDMELNSEYKAREHVSDGEPSQDAKSQLADIQKLLVETNRKNQAKRKMILPDSENSQQLPEDKKIVILDLAKKQRNLLEGFKRYKNIVQRLKTIKRLKSTSQNASQIAQNLPAFSSMSVPNSTHGSQPLNSSAQFPISGEHSDSGVQVEVVSQNRSTTATCGVLTTPRVVMTNVTNPAGTKALRPSSIKKQTTVSTPMLDTAAPSPCVNAIIIASSTGQRHQQLSTFCPATTNQTPSKRSSTRQAILAKTLSQMTGTNPYLSEPSQSQPLTIRLSANQPTAAKTPSQTAGITATSCPRSNISQTTIRPSISRNPYPSSSRSNQVSTNALTINEVTVQTTESQDSSRLMRRIPNRPGMNENVFKPAANRSSTSFNGSNSCTFSTGITPSSVVQHANFLPNNRPSSTDLLNADRQSSILTQGTTSVTTKQIPELSLEKLLKKGILVPGRNVLTTESEGKLYSASISDKGTIISAGGEGFTSPRSWLKAILGSRRKVKNELAWKMVSYKNKPLLDHACAPVTTSLSETPANLNIQDSQAQDSRQIKISQNNTRRELINSTRALKALLRNCRVLGISDEEVFSLEQQRENFWDDSDADVLDAFNF